MPGKRYMPESVVGQGIRRTRSLGVKRQGDRAIIVSRGGHVPPGRARRSSTGQRMAGETCLIDSGLQGRTLRKSWLIPIARIGFSGKRCAGKPARIVWEGGNGKGL